MISLTAEYALRAVVCLANQDGVPLVTPKIADITHVPAGYLAKVLQMLSRAGIVRSHKGYNGGFVLTRDQDELTVLEVVNAVDPPKRITSCPLGLQQHGKRLCPLHRRLDDVAAQVEQAFAEFTIHDLLTEPNESVPLGLTRSGLDAPPAQKQDKPTP